MIDLEQYLEELRLKKKYIKRPSTWEVSETFSDCRAVAVRLATLLSDELEVYDKWIAKEPFNKYFKQVDKRYIRLNELKKFLSFTRPVKNGEKLDIAKAKAVPIQELYDFQKKKTSRDKIHTVCPLHTERTGSLVIYTDNNSFYCFGCGVGGDAISFVQHLYDLKFVDAVKKLTR